MIQTFSVKTLLLAVAIITAIAVAVYELLDSTKAIRKDQIVGGARSLEKHIESIIDVEKISVLKRYKGVLGELVPSESLISIYLVIGLSSAVSYVVFEVTRDFLNQVPAALLLGMAVFTVPFLALELYATYNRNRLRERLPHFLLMFQQTQRVTGDSLQTLATIQGNIKEPVAGLIREFLKNIRKGVEYKTSVEVLKSRTDNEVLKAFADNLYMDLEYGKLIGPELENNIKAAFAHIENYSQRITENSGNIVSVLGVLFMFFVGAQRLLAINEEFLYIIRYNREGQVLANIIIIIIIAVFYLLKKSIAYRDR